MVKGHFCTFDYTGKEFSTTSNNYLRVALSIATHQVTITSLYCMMMYM